jgi:hypothetical protein
MPINRRSQARRGYLQRGAARKFDVAKHMGATVETEASELKKKRGGKKR